MPDPSPSPSPGPRRRWLRLSVRGLMLLVLGVGVALAWPVVVIHRQRAAIRAVEAAGGQIQWDYPPIIMGIGSATTSWPGEPPPPNWIRRQLGEELFQNVDYVNLTNLRSTAVLAVLPRFARVQGLNLVGPGPPGPNAEVLRALPRLKYLALDGPWVTDEVLAAAGTARLLERLSIQSPAMTDAGISHLANLPNMDSLFLTLNPAITDATLARVVAGMPRLTYIQLSGQGQAIAATMAVLGRQCPHLWSLQLDGLGITDADLEPISHLAQLNSLILKQGRITGAGLDHVARLPKLQGLVLIQTGLAGGDLAHLSGPAALMGLDCMAMPITDASLPALAAFPNLWKLDLTATEITDAGLPALGKSASISHLILDDTPVTPSGVAALQAIRPQMGIAATRRNHQPPGSTPTPP